MYLGKYTSPAKCFCIIGRIPSIDKKEARSRASPPAAGRFCDKILCRRMAILAEGDAQERGDIIYLEKLPLFNPDGTVLG